MMRMLRLIMLTFFVIGAGGPASALPEQAPGHIPEFPHIDLRWSKNEAIYAFGRNDIGRLDLSTLTVAEYNTTMRRFLAGWIRVKRGNEYHPDLRDFGCEHFERPISARRTLKVRHFSLCFLNNALILVNVEYSDSVSASEIKPISTRTTPATPSRSAFGIRRGISRTE